MKNSKNLIKSQPHVAFTAGLAGLLLLAGCAGDPSPAATEAPASGSSSAAAGDSENGEVSGDIQIHDAWVKAEKSGMTAAFGVIQNGRDSEITVTEVNTEISDVSELHLTVVNGAGSMVMEEAPDGFSVESGASFVLEPGGNHLMLMELNQPVAAGDEVAFELVLDDGSTVDFVAVAKDYSGANESYDHGDHDSGTDDQSEDDSDHDH